MAHQTILFLVLSILFIGYTSIKTSLAKPPNITKCDNLAGDIRDPNNIGKGTDFPDIQPYIAIKFCKESLRIFPNEQRFMHQLGRAYDASKDYHNALIWYKKASNKGSVASMNNIGILFANKNIPTKTKLEAVKWYRKAAENGYTPAMVNLGKLNRYGRNIAVNHSRAAEWFKKAAKSNNRDGMFNLAHMIEKGEITTERKKDQFTWYKKAANKGDVASMGKLSLFYYKGKYIPKSCKLSTQWAEKAYYKGANFHAPFLGYVYFQGCKDMPKDLEKAMKWLKKSAEEHNDKTSMGIIYEMYKNGIGVPKDPGLASYWYGRITQ